MAKVLNVLIVEDEPIICVFLKALVESNGHKVLDVVSSGEEALVIIANNNLDLIFMDINIKGSLDGISVVREIKTESKPLIYFISAYNDIDTIEDALSTNAYNYITKPIKEEDIVIALTMAKKHSMSSTVSNKIVFSKDLIYIKDKKELYLKNEILKLSKIEKKLVDLFISNLNSIVSIETITYNVWAEKDVDQVTIRGAIARLKKKVSLNIENHIGRGYILIK